MSSLSHIWNRPLLQLLHVPSWPPCHGPPARSPSFHFFSPGPTATTMPMTSWPGMRGNLALRERALVNRSNACKIEDHRARTEDAGISQTDNEQKRPVIATMASNSLSGNLVPLRNRSTSLAPHLFGFPGILNSSQSLFRSMDLLKSVTDSSILNATSKVPPFTLTVPPYDLLSWHNPRSRHRTPAS